MKKLLQITLLAVLAFLHKYTEAQTVYSFKTCGATGSQGPTQTQVNNTYTGANPLTGTVTINTQGIQEWVVPSTGTYLISMAGAKGGDGGYGSGGPGRKIYTEVTLTAGTVLKIVVGQQGQANGNTSLFTSGGSGGGGSFVYYGSIGGSNLIAAAAGGGGGLASNQNIVGTNNNTGNYGNNGSTIVSSSFTALGGTSGNGGGFTNRNYLGGGPGSGWFSDGNTTYSSGTGANLRGTRFQGGIATAGGRDGGFGGGGASGEQNPSFGSYVWAGGGGGYSGGACGHNSGNSDGQVGGGGGSFLTGINQKDSGTNSGNGFVTITRMLTPASLNFDGNNDYVAVAHKSVQVGMSNLTLEAWVYISGSSGIYRNVMVKGNYGYGMIIDNNNQLGYWSNSSYSLCPGFGTVPMNTWTHCAIVVRQGISTNFFINGVNVGSSTSSGHTTINSGSNDSLIFGREGTGCNCNFFQGKMDEIRIWNTARTGTEILNSMNCELPTTSGLIARYNCDNGAPAASNSLNDTLTDISGNWARGKLRNFALTGTSSNWDFPAVGQEIAVTGLGNNISDGDITPSLTDGTDFGKKIFYRTFVINNSTVATLKIDSVRIAGANSSDFSAYSLSSSSITTGASSNLVIRFSPSALGLRTATVNIFTNDCDESIFNFDVSGIGIKATAIEFDGTNDKIVSNSNLGIVGNSSRTIEFWAKLDDKNQFAHLANWGSGGNNLESFGLYANGGSLYFHGWGTGDYNTGYSTDTFWHHFAATYDGTAVKTYVDGVATPTSNVSRSLNTPNAQLYLGIREDNNLSTTFDGKMDHLRVWSVAKTQSEIQSGLNCELKSGAGLLLSYYFNQGVYYGINSSITTVVDSSVGALHATASNFSMIGTNSNWTIGDKLGQNILLYGNSVFITAGDTTPSVSDFTDMNNTATQQFAIFNDGTSDLVISSITKTGKNPSNFAISSITPSSSIAPLTYGYFTVTYSSTNDSTKSADINIFSNDCENGKYTFRVKNKLKTGSGLNFDGNDDFISTPVILPANSSYTKEAWVKIKDYSNWNLTIIGSNNYYTTLRTENGRLTAGHPNDYNWSGVQDPNQIPLNTWVHVAVTFNASTNRFKLYKNGVFLRDGYSNSHSTDSEISIGGMGTGYLMLGSLDEVRVWDYVRTDCEIALNYQCEIRGSQTGLLANYHFNQGIDNLNNSTINTLTDSSGNGNNGTLNNFALTDSIGNWITPTAIQNGFSCNPATTVAITGNGNAISTGSTSLSFSNFTRFDTLYVSDSQARKYYVHNTGSNTLYIYGVNKTGPDASMFSYQSISFPKAINPGDSFAIDIKFKPKGFYNKKTNISIHVNSCSPQYYSFEIGGFVKLKEPTVSVSPTIFCGGNATITSYADSANKILYYSDSVGGTFLGSSNNGSGFTVTPPGNTNYYYAQSMAVVSKTIKRDIAQSDLINHTNNCGGGIRYSGGNPGFAFTDNTTGTITNIDVDFAIGVHCSSGSKTLYLNSNAQSSVNTNNSCTCSPLESTNGVTNLSLNISNFNKGGYNEITIDNTSGAMGFMPHSNLDGFYARVYITVLDTIYSKKRTKIEISKNCKEINVKGNNIGIVDGDNTPSLIDSTDFGNVCSGAIRNYKIYNTGSGILAIDSIRFSGSNATDFSVISAPAAVAGYDSAILSVKVMATTTGIKTATIKIYNDDADETVYDFTLSASLNVKPLFTSCPSNLSGFSTASSCDTIFNYTTTAAGNGNSFTYTFKTATVASGLGNGSGSAFNNGTTNVTVIANNVCGVDSCKFNVIVTDNKKPSITCSGNKTVKSSSGVCTYTHTGTAWNPSFGDNCAGSTIAFVLSGATTGTGTTLNNVVFNKGITTVTWTATDGSSNMSSCNYTVTVNDSTSPSITCTGNKIVNNDNGVCTYTHSGTAWDPSFSDNCSGSSIAYALTGVTTGTGTSIAGRAFNIGVTTVAWTVTDAAGNTETCNYLVTVNSPEINVTGNSISIVDNDITPSLADSTNFGFVSPNTKRRFIIQNTGTNTLNISSVSLSGANASDFTVSGAPSSITPGGSASILVTLITTAPGIKSATVTINNNDCNEAIYNFEIQGEIKCDFGSNIANTVGTHVSSYALTNAAGWTCYCNTSGQLLLALKLGGTGAVVPSTGVELKINSTNATWYPHSTGFVGNWHGWAGLDKTWEVYPTTQPSSSVPVRFFVSSADMAAVNTTLIANSATPISSVSQMSFYKVINSSKPAHSPITNLGQSDVQIYSNTSSTYGELPFADSSHGSGKHHVQFNVTSFSGGGGGSGGIGLTPLSVTLSKQNAIWVGNDAVVNWVVASENNNSHFIILRSENNSNWIEVGKIPSTALNGNSTTAIEYQFKDKGYKQRLNGIALYRIAVISKNGETYRHSPMTLRNVTSTTGIKLMPNPTTGDITILGIQVNSEQATIQIWNSHGKLMKTFAIATQDGSFASNCSLSEFSEGVYNVRIVCGESTYTEKVIFMKGK